MLAAAARFRRRQTAKRRDMIMCAGVIVESMEGRRASLSCFLPSYMGGAATARPGGQPLGAAPL